MLRRIVIAGALLVLLSCRSTAWRSVDPAADPGQLHRDIAACRLESQQVQGVDPFPTWMRLSAYDDCMISKGYEPDRPSKPGEPWSGGSLTHGTHPCIRLDAEGMPRKQMCSNAPDGALHDESVKACMNQPMTIAMFDYRSPEGLQAARDHCEREATAVGE